MKSFLFFSLLPQELQEQIWHSALPEDVGPAICVWKPGCWTPRFFSPGDEEFMPAHPDHIELRFAHEMLDGGRLMPALLHVNRTARTIAMQWLSSHGFTRQQNQLWQRPFDPARDVMFLPPESIESAMEDQYNRMMQPDVVGRGYSATYSVGRVAFLSDTICEDRESVYWMWNDFHAMYELVVLRDRPETMRFGCWWMDSNVGSRATYEVEPGSVRVRHTMSFEEDSEEARILEAAKAMVSGDNFFQVKKFEVLPMVARQSPAGVHEIT